MTKQNRWASMLMLILSCIMCVFMGACQFKVVPEKVQEGISIDLTVGEKKEILVEDYIATNGYAVTTSVDKKSATATLAGNKVTITAVEKGNCVVTLSCESVKVSFHVTVKATSFSVTVDGTKVGNYEKGSEYVLPAYTGTIDNNHEFLGWIVNGDSANLKQAKEKITVQENLVITAKIELKKAVVVKATDEKVLTLGAENTSKVTVNVADYITSYGREVTVASSAKGVATATLKDGVITIAAVAKGNANVTISCEGASATISVTVKAQKFSVTVDGTKVGDYEEGSQYELPAYTGTIDNNHEFLGWIVNGDGANLKQAKDKVTVQANVVITAKIELKKAVVVKATDEKVLTLGSEDTSKVIVNVADYIANYGREVTAVSSAADVVTATLENGVVTIVGLAKGKASVTISCEGASATISVTVNPETVMPTFENGSIAIDLFTQTSGSYTAVIVANPTEMTFTYAVENNKASVDANGTITYNADDVETVALTVNVVATNPYDGLTHNLSFTVEVVVTDTTPQAPVFEDKSLTYDLYEVQDGVAIEGGLKAEDDNFTYVYTVDGKEVVEGHKFAQTATVNVVYTYKGNTAKSGNTSFIVTVTAENTTPTIKEADIVAESVIDIVNNPTLDLAANVTNTQNVKGYKVNGEAVDGNVYTFVDDGYGETEKEVTFTVTVINTKDVELTYTYTVSIRNTDEFCVKNGGFETGNTDGWTVTEGMGSVSDATTYWGELSHQKEGNFFFMGREEKGEGTFVLQSEAFTVHGSGWLTFQMGAAKHFEHQYVEVVKVADDSVIAHVTNAMFADKGGFEGDPNKVSGETLMKYKLDLSSVLGESVYVRVVDTWAGGDFGRILFDNLVTYIPDAESISADYADVTKAYFVNVATEIDLKDSNTAEIIPSVKSQGLTALSYTYEAAVAEDADGLTVDGFKVTTTKCGNYQVNYTVKCGDEEIATFVAEVTVSNTTQLPTIENVSKTVEHSAWSTGEATEVVLPEGDERFNYSFSVDKGTVEGNKLSYVATEAGEVVITVTVSLADKNYTVEDLGTVTFTVTLVFKEAGIMLPTEPPEDEHYDVFELESETLTVNFDSEKYIIVPENMAASIKYSATLSVDGGAAEEVQLTNNGYAIELADHSEVATQYTFVVTASCDENTVTYTLNVYVVDSTVCRLVNGGFEDGMEGWTKVGNIGDIDTATHYWVNDPERAEGFAFGMDGEKMFSAYAPGAAESAVGTLTSSSFKVGGSGFVTFKIGALRDGNYVYVDVVDAESKQILARYNNGLWAERTDGVKSGCTLIAYKADLSAFMGREVFFRISDNADSGYGLFFADSFITYYATEPEGFNVATPVNYEVSGTIYDIFNGGFEMGGVQGWWNAGEPGAVTGADAFFSGVAYGKEGNFLYSGVEDYQAGNGREGNRGVLTSSTFEIGGIGYISFMLGGGGNELCYVQVIDAVTGEVLVRYHQQEMQDAVLKQYVADLSAYIGKTVRVQVVDQAENNWGCVSFDNLKTYYANVESLPVDAITAIDIKGDLKYTIDNGGFESGNLDGWTMNITEAGAHNTLGWVESSEHDAGWYAKNDDTKEGNYLFTFTKPDGTNCENTKGTLQSSTFSLKQGAFVAFKFGGAGGAQNHDVHIQLCRADGSVIATFFNDAEGKVNTRMNAYYYQYQGVEVNCFFRIVDNSTGDYGCFVVDDFRVNLESAPEGFIPAIS